MRPSADAARALADRVADRAERYRGVRAVRESFDSEQRSGAGLLAGGLAYRFFLWLVPFGLVIAAISSFWARESPESLSHAATHFGLGGVAARSATSAVRDGSRARWYLLSFGVVLATWAGITAVRALRIAAVLAWRLEPQRMRSPLRASAAFAVVTVLGLGASVATSWARHNLGAVGLVVTLAAGAAYAAGALFALDHLPRPAHIGWREQLPGALLIGAGITGVHVFLAYYLAARLERTPSLYGALGASTVVLLVLYLIARLVISAMFLNATLDRRRASPVPAS